jgi:Uma2 family endonuclease
MMVGDALHLAAEETQIMGMPVPRAITTIEELLALPEDGLRHELLDGEYVVTPAPSLRHQRVLGRLFVALRSAIDDNTGLEALWSPADIQLGPRTLVQPDLFVLRRPLDPAATWKDVGVPLLAVEVLSPTTAVRDRGKKRRLYLEAGVEEYWIVDLDPRLIERWRRGDQRPEMVDDTLEWQLSTRAKGRIDLPKLFDG